MERKEILEKVQSILAEIVGEEGIVLTEATRPSEVEDWNSLTHFQLMVELQKEFNIKFVVAEIQLWETVGNIIDSIESKLV